jgi:sulfide:quinone oxidoreductase
MDIRKITRALSVSPQIAPADMIELKMAGFRSVICNRPDGEGADQPTFAEIEKAAKTAGIEARYLPIVSGRVGDEDAGAFDAALQDLPGPVLAYCRTGTRSTTLVGAGGRRPRHAVADILAATKAAGYDMAGVVRRIANGGKTPTDVADVSHDIVIIGGGGRHLRCREPARPRFRARHRDHRPAGRALLPAGLDHGGRRHLRAGKSRPAPWRR